MCIRDSLVPPTDGKVIFLGKDVSRIVEKRPRELLKELQMVFQNPETTINPSRSVGETIARPLRLFGTVPRSKIRPEVESLLEAVKLGKEYYNRKPHQLSGGEKQRVAIARAFASRPTLVLCDEPLSSLDVSVQAAILNLLREFQRRYATTLIFISHDLSVVRYVCDRVAIMYLGKIVEMGEINELFDNPQHPYSEALLAAVPIPDPHARKEREIITGEVPTPIDPPKHCRFAARCKYATDICFEQEPSLEEYSKDHYVACFNIKDDRK